MFDNLIEIAYQQIGKIDTTIAFNTLLTTFTLGAATIYIAFKTYWHSVTKAYIDKRRQFIKDCKPIINNQIMLDHEETLLIDSYYHLTNKKLDITVLKTVLKLSKENKTITEFIIAGHLIHVSKGNIIDKTSTKKRFLNLLWLTVQVITLIFAYFSTINTLTYIDNLIGERENLKSLITIYILLLLIGFSLALIILKSVTNKMDRYVSLKRLLALNP